MRRILLVLAVLLVAARAASADPTSLRKERAHRRSVRSAGHLLMGGGVALGALAGAAYAMGQRAGDAIQVGGFDTSADIEAKADEARRYQRAALYLAGAGAAAALTGFALVVTHPDPRAPRIEAAPVPGGAIVGISGVLP